MEGEMNMHTMPPARNPVPAKMPAPVVHYEAPEPLSADDYYAKKLARYAKMEVKAHRALGFYENTMETVAVGKAAGVLAAKNTTRRKRSKRIIEVLRLVDSGVTNSLNIRIAVGLEKNTGMFRDLVANGELIRTAPATYAITDKGREALAKEGGNG